MDTSYFINPIVFLVKTLFGIYTTLLVLRFLLQWARADFHNPISQFVVKLTGPVLQPVRRIVPSIKGMDTSSLVVAWVVKSIELLVIALLLGASSLAWLAPLWAIPALVKLVLNLFLFAILIRVILSWVNPDPYNPAVSLLGRLTDPLMLPAQRLLPPIGGLDLSPMVVMIVLVLLQMLLLPPLLALSMAPAGLML
ncbi:YggT family protein [Thiorhodovibrio frisius]|uniref:Putative integral membrane protein n=1 Tax=Thiorhodovibrio frisius TaxID=631362 RepID=H8Z7N5_9GAMM|nr:YggT family protein [Thiorhodovibrio frisius]EIC19888.1 putative integral membrane protein [Thiorhodovibrio frisius]WPL20616.1 YGGT family protein [Thiorhodovibrio frisius]